MKKFERELHKASKTKRPVTISVTVDPDLLARVDKKREWLGITRAKIIEEAFKQFMDYRF